MKSIPYEGYLGIRLPREVQWKRVQTVLKEELTDRERQTLTAYYIDRWTIPQIAIDQGVNRSTAWRNLKRAEKKLRRFLRY